MAVAPEMVPGFHVFVYLGLKTGEVISDSIFVPVDNFQRHKLSMIVNGAKDRSKDTVEVSWLMNSFTILLESKCNWLLRVLVCIDIHCIISCNSLRTPLPISGFQRKGIPDI